MTEQDNAAAPAASEGEAASTIQDTMAAVYDRMTKEDAPEAEAPAETVESAPDKPASDDRPRGPDGKFVPKSAAPEKAPETPPAVAAKTTTETEAAHPAAPEQQPEKVLLPRSWQNEQRRQLFVKAPPEVQKALAEREAEMEAGVAKLQQRFQPYEQLVAPIRQQLAIEGRSPEQYLSALMAADQMLRENPQQALGQIARMYGVNMPGAQQAEPQDPVYAELQQVKSQLAQLQQAPQQAVMQTAQSEIDAFAADPANVHFPTVRPIMAALMQNGAADSLKAAYDLAIGAHPQIRSQLEAERQQKAQAEAAEQARVAAAKAQRAASVNAATKGGNGVTQATRGTMRDTMKQVADRLMT
jgi:hypothetical protein